VTGDITMCNDNRLRQVTLCSFENDGLLMKSYNLQPLNLYTRTGNKSCLFFFVYFIVSVLPVWADRLLLPLISLLASKMALRPLAFMHGIAVVSS